MRGGREEIRLSAISLAGSLGFAMGYSQLKLASIFVSTTTRALHTNPYSSIAHVHSLMLYSVSHSRPRSEVADLDSRSGVLTASWLDSEGVD